MKTKIICCAILIVSVCAFGLYKWHHYNYADLVTEYYTVETILPCEEDYAYAQLIGGETEPKIQIPRKNEYLSDEEAISSEQESANYMRSFCREYAIEEARKSSNKKELAFNYIFRCNKRESGALYNIVKISHTRKTDLTELWNIIKEYGLVSNEWRNYCESNNIKYDFLPLKNDGEGQILAYELSIDKALGKGYNYRSKWTKQGISLNISIYNGATSIDKLSEDVTKRIIRNLSSTGARKIRVIHTKDDGYDKETIAFAFEI